MRKIVVFVVLVLVVSATGIVLATKYDDWFVTPGVIKAKRGHTVQSLRDPATVQFKDERLTRFGWLCGELNGKNAYGAYTGFKRFMSRSYDDVYIEGSGYAGKPDTRSTAQIIADLDVKNEVIKSLLTVAKNHPDIEKPSQADIDGILERAVFKKRWAEHCT